MYAIAKSTAAAIVRKGIIILWDKLVPEVICFPTGPELKRVMVDFKLSVVCHAVLEL